MGIADGLPLEEPVDEKNIRDVKWLHVFDRYQPEFWVYLITDQTDG